MSQATKNLLLKIIALVQALGVSIAGLLEGQMTTQAVIMAVISAIVAFAMGLFHTQPGQEVIKIVGKD